MFTHSSLQYQFITTPFQHSRNKRMTNPTGGRYHQGNRSKGLGGIRFSDAWTATGRFLPLAQFPTRRASIPRGESTTISAFAWVCGGNLIGNCSEIDPSKKQPFTQYIKLLIGLLAKPSYPLLETKMRQAFDEDPTVIDALLGWSRAREQPHSPGKQSHLGFR